jgi:hypothetical protein
MPFHSNQTENYTRVFARSLHCTEKKFLANFLLIFEDLLSCINQDPRFGGANVASIRQVQVFRDSRKLTFISSLAKIGAGSKAVWCTCTKGAAIKRILRISRSSIQSEKFIVVYIQPQDCPVILFQAE